MYIPSAFRVDDHATLLDFIEQFGFATLVTVREGVPFATHVPLLLDRAAGVLAGHLAHANPQWQDFASGNETLAIFSGPHAYVSPSWYASTPAVPTWNYAAVHVYGVPRLLTAERTRDVIDRTVEKYESGRAAPWPNDLPADFRARMLAAVVGFELPLTRLEGKFKLGQNRSAADRAGMLRARGRRRRIGDPGRVHRPSFGVSAAPCLP